MAFTEPMHHNDPILLTYFIQTTIACVLVRTFPGEYKRYVCFCLLKMVWQIMFLKFLDEEQTDVKIGIWIHKLFYGNISKSSEYSRQVTPNDTVWINSYEWRIPGIENFGR